jgi:hypothetical protein
MTKWQDLLGKNGKAPSCYDLQVESRRAGYRR